MEIVDPRTIDWSILAMLGATERATAIVEASCPWRRMLEMGAFPAYRETILEFLSTFEFHPPQARGMEALDQLQAVSFTLCGQEVRMSLTQWGIATGFYTREEVSIPLFLDVAVDEDEAVLIEWWPVIGDAPFVNKARVSRIRDPLHRYLHWYIAYTITGCRLSQEWVTQKDLFFIDRMTKTYASTLLVRNTVMLMGIAAEIPGVGLQWSPDGRTVWVPPVPAPQQQPQPGTQPHVQQPPPAQPPPPHHAVVCQP
ncbi:hypothetical protein R6Q57_010886 [Mikania cordata]